MMTKRRCENCEYYIKKDSYSGRCHRKLRKSLNDHWGFPMIFKVDFCMYWEPIWDENPNVKEAWDQFQMTLKLIKEGEE